MLQKIIKLYFQNKKLKTKALMCKKCNFKLVQNKQGTYAFQQIKKCGVSILTVNNTLVSELCSFFHSIKTNIVFSV